MISTITIIVVIIVVSISIIIIIIIAASSSLHRHHQYHSSPSSSASLPASSLSSLLFDDHIIVTIVIVVFVVVMILGEGCEGCWAEYKKADNMRQRSLSIPLSPSLSLFLALSPSLSLSLHICLYRETNALDPRWQTSAYEDLLYDIIRYYMTPCCVMFVSTSHGPMQSKDKCGGCARTDSVCVRYVHMYMYACMYASPEIPCPNNPNSSHNRRANRD